MEFIYPIGSTPLELDEIEKLIPKHIRLQSELNEWEQFNILQANLWLKKQKTDLINFTTIKFCKLLHKKMFDKTWKWAGEFRKTDKNIGIDWLQISVSLKMLFDDLIYQINYKTYTMDEIAIRFHHRLVHIHAFVNGNGRHARVATDFLLTILGQNVFSWGRNGLIFQNETRNKYIKALQAADKGDYKLLLNFVRS